MAGITDKDKIIALMKRLKLHEYGWKITILARTTSIVLPKQPVKRHGKRTIFVDTVKERQKILGKKGRRIGFFVSPKLTAGTSARGIMNVVEVKEENQWRVRWDWDDPVDIARDFAKRLPKIYKAVVERPRIVMEYVLLHTVKKLSESHFKRLNRIADDNACRVIEVEMETERLGEKPEYLYEIRVKGFR